MLPTSKLRLFKCLYLRKDNPGANLDIVIEAYMSEYISTVRFNGLGTVYPIRLNILDTSHPALLVIHPIFHKFENSCSIKTIGLLPVKIANGLSLIWNVHG